MKGKIDYSIKSKPQISYDKQSLYQVKVCYLKYTHANHFKNV